MWPLYLTRTVTLEKRIAASKAELLSILHDPNQVLHLSPMVCSVVQDPKDPSWYVMTETLPILGGLFKSSTTFRCRWTKVVNGCDCEVHAGAGTRLINEMRAVEGEESGSVVFTEKVVVQGWFFFMPFIKSTMTKGHIAMMDALAAKVLKKD